MAVVMANLEKIMFLRCSTNHLADTVLGLFEDAIKDNRGLWPSHIRIDHDVRIGRTIVPDGLNIREETF